MKLIALIILFSMARLSLPAQYFFTGEVTDSHGDGLQNGSINVLSTGASYRTGLHGEFGITSRKPDDTLLLSFDGYKSFTTAVSATGFLKIILQSPPIHQVSKQRHLKSVFKNSKPYGNDLKPYGNEQTSYDAAENPFVDQSVSVSFSGKTDHASYPIIRKFLDMGYTAPHDAVQIEEMLNYFSFSYEEPDTGTLFHCSSNLLSCPWNDQHKLFCLNICAGKVDLQTAPPGNLVFLIDASGSMDLPDKLPMIKSAIRLLINNLRDIDTISVIEFGGKLRVLAGGLPGSEKGKIMDAIEGLEPDGPTPGEEGLKLAYEVAQRQFITGGTNKIILITDGDISEGPSGKKKLEDLIGEQSQDGIRLSCIEVGARGSRDSELPDLAKTGQGSFAHVTDEEEAERMLVSELAPTSFCVADSVFITTDFNPALVKEYRLIGFDNKRNPEDTGSSGSSGFEGSQIGSGHSLLALFELVLKENSAHRDTIAEVKINYCLPGQNSAKMISYSCPDKLIVFDRAEKYLKKAACIALFGMKLQESGYVSQISWTDMEKMAKKIFSGNNCFDREYLETVGQAKNVYTQSGRRGKKNNP